MAMIAIKITKTTMAQIVIFTIQATTAIAMMIAVIMEILEIMATNENVFFLFQGQK